jgi:hypothetical protein
MKILLVALLVALIASVEAVRADRGAIPFRAKVTVFEPNQRALVAWNGDEEILVLSTDLRVSQATKVLEVMPFPAEPSVTNADVTVFQRAVDLINAKVQRMTRAEAEELMRTRGGPRSPPPAGEITFHEKIGAHDVAVARVIDPAGFVGWVNDYLKRAQAGNPTIPALLQASVGEYLGEGFTWFAFDVIALDDRLKTTDALEYRFKTPSLYYPIKISRANQGLTSIQLLVLTPTMLGTFSGIPMRRVDLRHMPVSLSSTEVRSLHAGIDDLLGRRDDVKLRIWWIRGTFQDLSRDLLAR